MYRDVAVPRFASRIACWPSDACPCLRLTTYCLLLPTYYVLLTAYYILLTTPTTYVLLRIAYYCDDDDYRSSRAGPNT